MAALIGIVLFLMWLPDQASALVYPPSLTVNTEKSKYDLHEKVIVSGRVSAEIMEPDQLVSIYVFNPEGKLYISDEVEVAWNGNYFYNFVIEGELALPGNYEILVTYIHVQAVEIISYIEEPSSSDFRIYVLRIDQEFYPISYKLSEGSELNLMVADTGSKLINLLVSAPENGGQITIELPREIIDSRDSNKDREFVVAIGASGGGIFYTDAFEEIETFSEKRTLLVELLPDVENFILIRGTHIIPEFPISIIIASISIGVMIALMKFGRFKSIMNA
jgi:hypothetical protein